MKVKEIPFIDIKLYENDGTPVLQPDDEFKSELVIGNIYIRFTKKFNWFQRLMLRLVFGLNIYKI